MSLFCTESPPRGCGEPVPMVTGAVPRQGGSGGLCVPRQGGSGGLCACSAHVPAWLLPIFCVLWLLALGTGTVCVWVTEAPMAKQIVQPNPWLWHEVTHLPK